ncbi:hypothetical protein [Kaistella sp.]|uniref:hypothetical protein n=1 Tax=Kaistella sp. TaxID=2782235 RepID=UPI003C5013BD
MKKIAYIELDTHAEIAANFMELMNDSNEFSVDYYFSEKMIKQIGKQNSTIFLTENSELLNQLKNQNYDLIIIGTVHRYFNLFNEISRKFNTSVIVHNLNFIKISRFQLFKNIFKKDFKYRLKLWLKEDLLSAPEVFENAKNLLVLDENLVQDKMKFLPIFFNEFNEKQSSEIFTIVVPGTVSQERRDYFHVLKSIKTFKKETRFQFVFLGKAKGKELVWLTDFEKSKPENISLKYFTEKVSQDIFDDWMKKAHVLWCPIQTETEFFNNKEIYGKTKMSGNIGDTIKYGKIVIFPENYPNSQAFIILEKSNIEEQLLNCEKSINYDFQKKFNKEKILNELEKTLETLIKI